MSLKFVHGNILDIKDPSVPTVICHQVNCMGVMGSGLAKQIREKYPIVYDKYKSYCDMREKLPILGHTCFVDVMNNVVVANMFGQFNYGSDGKRYTNYMALKKALEDVALYSNGMTIRIPYLLGCGLGGGDWKVVFQIIKETLLDYDFDVEIWRLQ